MSVPSRGVGEGAGSRPEKHSYHIEALARGLAVLDAFSPQRPELTLRDVAEAAGVTQPSALRIGHTLMEAGYLVRNPSTKGYRLGPRMVAAALATLSAMPLPEIAEPYLLQLRDATQETVKLAVPSGIAAVIVSYVPSRLRPPGDQFIGSSMPLYAGSLGRTILAWLPESSAESILSRSVFKRYTAKTLSLNQVRRELPGIRKRGYALNDQATTTEHRAVAAPLLAPSGVTVGAVNVSVSALRYSLSAVERQLAPEVVRTAKEISDVLPPNVLGAGWLP